MIETQIFIIIIKMKSIYMYFFTRFNTYNELEAIL